MSGATPGDDTWDLTESPVTFEQPRTGDVVWDTFVADDSEHLDEEQALGTPPETELPDSPAP